MLPMSDPKKTNRKFELSIAALAFIVIVLAFITFLWFMSSSLNIKGDAINGSEAGGHFYVSSHGVNTEVPESIWRQNRFLGQVMCVLWPLALLSMGYLLFRYFFPAVMFGGNHTKYAEELKRTVESVSTSGSPLASVSCSGQLGGIYIRGPLMSATVYPSGVRLSTIFSSPTALQTDEIKQVVYKRGFWQKGIEIQHRSHNISGKVVLDGVSEDSDFARALNGIVGQGRVSIRA